MASALQVEKTGRQRGVIVNESEERTKARIELSKQEEGSQCCIDFILTFFLSVYRSINGHCFKKKIFFGILGQHFAYSGIRTTYIKRL